MAAYNIHEDGKRSQEVDTGILTFGTILCWVSESGIDRTGIGILCWIKLKGKNGHIYITVCAYQPHGKPTTSPMVLGTVYPQQRSYCITKGETNFQ